MHRRAPALVALVAGTVLALAGCSSGGGNAAAPATPGQGGSGGGSGGEDAVSVFASTNVWGSVAQAVGGEHVEVTAAVTRPEQDPHEYEATAQDKLAASQAEVVVANGGGYDDWVLELATDAPDRPAVVDAFDVSGLGQASGHTSGSGDEHAADGHAHDHAHDHGGVDEHVFYHLPTVKKVANRIAGDLGAADPTHAEAYTTNAREFGTRIDGLITKAEGIGRADPSATAVVTEPVVSYLLVTAGIEDITPEAFFQTSESGAPSVAALQQTTALLTDKTAQALIVNAQTQDDVSTRLEQAAQGAGLPVVEVYETFPPGVSDYPSFIDQTLTTLEGAYGGQ